MNGKQPKWVSEEMESSELHYEIGHSYTGTVEEIKMKMEICEICGSRLILKYATDFTNLVTHEKANCLECGNKVRNVIHSMQ